MTENVATEHAESEAEQKKPENPLSDYEDEELEDELKRRGFFVFDEDPAEQGCFECEQRAENLALEKIHYLIANGKHAEAIERMREFIDDEIGMRSA